MEAVIKVARAEDNEELLEKMKLLIKKLGKGDISFTIKESKKSSLFRKETKEEYWNRIKESKEEIKQGKGVVFTMEELEEFIHKAPGK